MHRIFINTFGKFLVGREEGESAYHAFLKQINQFPDEQIFCDFTGVVVLAPSYCDELFGEIEKEFPGRLVIDKAISHAFLMAFKTVEDSRGFAFTFSGYQE